CTVSSWAQGRLAHFSSRLVVVHFIRLRLGAGLRATGGGGGAQTSADLLAFTVTVIDDGDGDGDGEQAAIEAQFALFALDERAGGGTDDVDLTGGPTACFLTHRLDDAPDRAFRGRQR
ncbi:hypothetical protein, partial [Streptomyces europaeiscabiei]|uniref:hypothetical protein n=1 Tax=Streptomyces europaeiscabiei TaxID=146819 RepID=UPI0029ADF28F